MEPEEYGQEKRRVKERNKKLSQLAQYLKKRAMVESAHAKAIQRLSLAALSQLDDNLPNPQHGNQMMFLTGPDRERQPERQDILQEAWISFLEADNDLCRTSGQFSRLVMGAIANDVADFKSQNKKVVEKIRNDKMSKPDQEEFLAAMFVKAGKAADEKALHSLTAYCDRYIEMMDKSAAVVKALREQLELKAETLLEEEDEDDVTIPELLETTPDVVVNKLSITFKKVALETNGAQGQIGNGKVSGYNLTVDLGEMRIAFVGKGSHAARLEYSILELLRIVLSKVKDSSRKKKKSTLVKLWSMSSSREDKVTFKSFVEREIFMAVLEIARSKSQAPTLIHSNSGENLERASSPTSNGSYSDSERPSSPLPPRATSPMPQRKKLQSMHLRIEAKEILAGPLSPSIRPHSPSVFVKKPPSFSSMMKAKTELSIFVGTFNMGNSLFPKELGGWIAPNHDLYVIGVQEAVSASSEAEDEITKSGWASFLKLLEKEEKKAHEASNEQSSLYLHALQAMMETTDDVPLDMLPYSTLGDLESEFLMFLEHFEGGESEEAIQNCVADFKALLSCVQLKEKKPEKEKKEGISSLRSRIGSGKDQWHLPLAKFLGEGYEVVGTEHLWGIRLVVLAKKEVFPRISQLEKAKVATGIAGMAGNKGAVGISLKVEDTSFCFVNSHLAAHQEKVKERNADYSRILKGLRLGFKDIDIVHQFDHVIWLGDLNYRLDFPREKVLNLISKRNFDGLYEFDQLRAEMRSGQVFHGFLDPVPTFPPTYKYEVVPQATIAADSSGGSVLVVPQDRVYTEKKQRVPSWCDRVLIKSQDPSSIKRTLLACCDDITISDHSPVMSTFVAQLRIPYTPPSLPSAVDTNHCQIRITQLKGPSHLTSKRSDAGTVFLGPFVCFHAPFLPFVYSSAVCTRKGGVEWTEDELPVLRSIIPEEGYLKSQFLTLVFLNKPKADYQGHESLGQCTVSLTADSFSETGAPFEAEVTISGRSQGRVTGVVQVTFTQGFSAAIATNYSSGGGGGVAGGGSSSIGQDLVEVSFEEDDEVGQTVGSFEMF